MIEKKSKFDNSLWIHQIPNNHLGVKRILGVKGLKANAKV